MLAPPLAVVLVHPEIPPNTGNVIRMTANAGAHLHLVEPLGFRMDDRELRRAGLDYHEHARVVVHRDWPACRAALAAEGRIRLFALSTRASHPLHDERFAAGDVFVLGSETAGLPDAVLADFPPERQLRLPMRAGQRSLNLSNGAAVAVFEAWRQLGFAGAG